MRYRIKLEWENEDGSVESAELGDVEAGACGSAADVGVKHAAAKQVLSRRECGISTTAAPGWRRAFANSGKTLRCERFPPVLLLLTLFTWR